MFLSRIVFITYIFRSEVGPLQAEFEPGHDFLPEGRPEPVSEILTRPDIFEQFQYPTKLTENEFDTPKYKHHENSKIPFLQQNSKIQHSGLYELRE